MRFYTVNEQHAVNADKISEVKVTGIESNCALVLIMDNHEPVTVRRFGNFHDAEIALRDLTDHLEARK